MPDMQRYALPFAAWEVRLYLDTHPDDANALNLYQELCARHGSLSYASLPSQARLNRWAWLDDPWPWEPEANIDAGRCDHVGL